METISKDAQLMTPDVKSWRLPYFDGWVNWRLKGGNFFMVWRDLLGIGVGSSLMVSAYWARRSCVPLGESGRNLMFRLDGPSLEKSSSEGMLFQRPLRELALIMNWKQTIWWSRNQYGLEAWLFCIDTLPLWLLRISNNGESSFLRQNPSLLK